MPEKLTRSTIEVRKVNARERDEDVKFAMSEVKRWSGLSTVAAA
jgi:hypothetical protein